MAVFIDQDTRILVQGITGRVGAFQTAVMQAYGSRILAGVTPGKDGQRMNAIPVYDRVAQALVHHRINAAISFVPARFARESSYEIMAAGIPFLVLTSEGMPEKDVIDVLRYAELTRTRVLGPDTPGLISPGKCKLGVHPHKMMMPGPVGVVSKSGSLSYEICRVLTDAGIGQSSVVGIGGGPLWGISHQQVLEAFENDPQTQAVVLLGEVGGTLEHQAAAFIQARMTKPVVALIVGRFAPPGAQMGHAGAIVDGMEGTAQNKMRALEQAGAYVAENPHEVVNLLQQRGV